MEILDRNVICSNRPLVLWRRKGDRHRRLTGSTRDNHVWTVKVPSRVKTVDEALDWMCRRSAVKK